MADDVSNGDRSGKRGGVKHAAAIAGAIATGAALTYVATTPSNSPPSHSGLMSPEKSPFITSDEAVAIYQQLKRTIEEKWKEAQDSKKPLRIFVLEEHGSKNALAYEMMLLDIVKRLGINTLAIEAPDEVYKTFSSMPIDWNNYQAPWQLLMERAHKSDMTVLPIDNRYRNVTEMDKAWKDRSEELGTTALRKAYQNDRLKLVDADPLTNKYRVTGFRPGEFQALDASKQAMLQPIVTAAFDEGYEYVRNERDRIMVQSLTGSALVLTGKQHGEGILTALRQRGDLDVAFSIYHETEKQSDAQTKGLPPEGLINWANNPKNTILCEGKDFNPQNLPIFVERAIERANIKGARGR